MKNSKAANYKEMTNTAKIKTRLSVMNFMEFAVWGAYLISMGMFLGNHGLGEDVFWFYTVQGLVSIIMPALMGIVADRWIPAQRTLALCQLLAGVMMIVTGAIANSQLAANGVLEFGPLFAAYTVSVAFFMPTIGLSNSVAFNVLNQNKLDTVTHFPMIRVFGTVGFILQNCLSTSCPGVVRPSSSRPRSSIPRVYSASFLRHTA